MTTRTLYVTLTATDGQKLDEVYMRYAAGRIVKGLALVWEAGAVEVQVDWDDENKPAKEQ